MKGLELSTRYFSEIGLPAIERELPECLPHMAAGMIGGSQCHENDDELSRDHGWGAAFTVWLDGADYDRFVAPLTDVLKRLPDQFLGVPASASVSKLGEYMKVQVGCEKAPETGMEWLHIPEESLFEITHRPVFYDGTGEVTRRFASFQAYPEDVWRQRLSACLSWLWEWGIKHHRRTVRRGDFITAAMYWCRFATYAMKVGFLLSRQYAPYHKWLYREFLKLPEPSREASPLIQAGFESPAGVDQIVSRIIDIYVRALQKQGFRPMPFTPEQELKLAYREGVELLLYARAVRASIEHAGMRELSSYAEVLLPAWRPTWMQVAPEG